MGLQESLAERLRAAFAAELGDASSALSAETLALEQAPLETDRVRTLFRIAHSLKGAAAAAGVPAVARMCHAIEDRLSLARDGTRALGPVDLSLLLEAADALARSGEALRVARDLPMGILESIEKRAQASSRTRAERRDGAAKRPTPVIGTATVPPAVADTLRIATEKLDALVASSSALFATRASLDDRRRETEQLADDVQRLQRQWRLAVRVLRLAFAHGASGGASTRMLDSIDTQLRDAARGITRLSDTLSRDFHALSYAVSDASHRAQQLRLRPFRDACQRLPRAVRDAAEATGHQVELVVDDGGVELDRAIVEALSEALLPIVRNAIDHGIEPPERRRALGKSETGKINITARLAGDRAIISITDDGAGVDEAAVRRTLRKRGITPPDDPVALGEALLHETLSTRAEVSTVSGRGVGLDIVAESMRRLGGTIRLSWQHQSGTTFTLECPPSLATVNALLVMVSNRLLGIPASHIARIMRLPARELSMAGGQTTLSTPEGALNVVPLAAILGPPLVLKPPEQMRHVIVMGASSTRLGVTVDAILGTQEMVLQPVERAGETFRFVAGVTMLGSGQLATILNATAVLHAGLSNTGAPLYDVPAVAHERDARRQRVLVVDDSITTRALESSLLEAAGYHVLSAVDGADAWKLLQEQSVDIVITDIEMPHMDGFELCTAIRGAPRLARMPVVLVTGLESPEHRSRGMQVGADAYIDKSTFDQDALLTTVRQLLGDPARA
jgi:two-component system chemotaxis sensor kinase CheA